MGLEAVANVVVEAPRRESCIIRGESHRVGGGERAEARQILITNTPSSTLLRPT